MGVRKIAAALFTGVLLVLWTCPVMAENSLGDESEPLFSHTLKNPGDGRESLTGSDSPSSSSALIQESLSNNQGIVSVNQSSGSLNNQSNLVALGFGGAAVPLEEAHSSVHATIEGSELSVPQTNRTDIISGSVKGNVGVIGINQSAGHGNRQTNELVLSLGEAVALSEAELTAVSTNNDFGVPDSPGNRLDTISDSFTNTQGIVQVSQSAGDGNVLGNRVAISFSSGRLR